MEHIIKSISDKISSYNIFNNLLPGIVFCVLLTKTTRFTISTDSILEQLFIWYFFGMIISRIGSILVEDSLKKLKIKKKPYLIFADYKQYASASEAKPFIATLSEANNTYRTIIALLISLVAIYLYDILLFDWIAEKCAIGNKLVAVICGVLLILLFIKSYKKQTDYIRKQVEKFMEEQNHPQ